MNRITAMFYLCLTACLAVPQVASSSESITIFQNVRIFDGTGAALTPPRHVLVRGSMIERISADPISVEGDASAEIIDGAGRTLMPGLIDVHTHLAMGTITELVLVTRGANYTTLLSGKAAGEMLMRGFASVRDAGGPVFGLKRAIDEGHIPGPRIWPSGALISQTSGHGDFRSIHDLPRADGELHFSERLGYAAIADGESAVLRRVREQLMQGASQIKLVAGGGVSSQYDPLDVSQYTEAELHAAVQAASAWGTYVMVHAYTANAIQSAVRAGVKCIEHGQLADEESIEMMAENNVWLSIQPFLGEPDPRFPEGSPHRIKQLQVAAGTNNTIALARKHGVKIAWGADILFNPAKARAQGAQLSVMSRWFEPTEVLRMATSVNAELLALSGARNPYPGKLGIVVEGALADLLLVDGSPLENLVLIENPEQNFVVIMKDGQIYKNSL